MSIQIKLFDNKSISSMINLFVFTLAAFILNKLAQTPFSFAYLIKTNIFSELILKK